MVGVMAVIGFAVGGFLGFWVFGVPGAIIGGLVAGGMFIQEAEKVQANAYLAQKRREEQGTSW